jgi:hypothetical protein
MTALFRYEKIFVKFPKSTKAFWDDNQYIIYCDPNIRGNYQVQSTSILCTFCSKGISSRGLQRDDVNLG